MSEWLVAEFLSAHRGLIHQTAFRDGEDSHALVPVTLGGGVVLAAARADRRTAGRRCRVRRGGDRDCARFCAELEVAVRKFIQRALVLEEHDLAEHLAAELRADRDLGHRRVADVFTTSVYPTVTMRAADDEAAFADVPE